MLNCYPTSHFPDAWNKLIFSIFIVKVIIMNAMNSASLNINKTGNDEEESDHFFNFITPKLMDIYYKAHLYKDYQDIYS